MIVYKLICVHILGDALSNLFAFQISTINNKLTSELDRYLKEFGISRSQYFSLYGIHNENKNSPSSLSRYLGINGAAVTRHLDELVNLKLVSRERGEVDRRSVILILTKKGVKLLLRLEIGIEKINSRYISSLSISEKKLLENILKKIKAF